MTPFYTTQKSYFHVLQKISCPKGKRVADSKFNTFTFTCELVSYISNDPFYITQKSYFHVLQTISCTKSKRVAESKICHAFRAVMVSFHMKRARFI